MHVFDCPHCPSGTKGVVIGAFTDRVTFRFPRNLASCDCELTMMERLQMVAKAAKEAIAELAAAV